MGLLGSPLRADAQLLVSAYGGAMHTRPADVKLEQPALDTALTFPEVPFRSESLDTPIYYGYRIAARIPGTRWLFVEGELIHAKLFARAEEAPPGTGRHLGGNVSAMPFTSVFDRFGVSHGMNFVLVNACVRKPFADDGRWLVTGRLGVGPMIPHPEIRIRGEGQEGYQLGGLGAQVAGGLERELFRPLSILAEYKFTLSRFDVSVPNGTVRFAARSHHLAVGLGLKF